LECLEKEMVMPNENTPASAPIASALLSITEQVGEHVLRCLRDEQVVAVISTIVPGVGPGADRVVSMPLDGQKMAEIDVLLQGLQAMPEEDFEEKCIGFQCAIPPK
jgi:hypothetical protein